MSRLLTRSRLVLLCVVSTAALSAPSAHAAKHHHVAAAKGGIVLSASHRTARLVDRHHRVIDVHVASAHGLRRGTIVAVHGGRVQLRGRARTISFYGRVLRRSVRGTVLRLADGSRFRLDAGRGTQRGGSTASTLTVDVQGLVPGQALLITIASDGRGNVALTLKPLSDRTNIGDGHHAHRTGDRSSTTPTAPGDQGDGADAGDEVAGTVTAIAPDRSSLTLDPGDGSDLVTISVLAPSALDGVSVGDDVAAILDDDGRATQVDVIGGGSEDPDQQPDGGDDGGDDDGSDGGADG